MSKYSSLKEMYNFREINKDDPFTCMECQHILISKDCPVFDHTVNSDDTFFCDKVGEVIEKPLDHICERFLLVHE